MDRSDEFKRDHIHGAVHDHTHDVHDHTHDEHDHPHDRTREIDIDRPAREGDILGLGGAAVPKSASDPSAENDPDSVAQRRARARADEAEHRSTGTATDSKGATGIDMGAGGQGTDVSGE